MMRLTHFCIATEFGQRCARLVPADSTSRLCSVHAATRLGIYWPIPCCRESRCALCRGSGVLLGVI